MEKLFMVQEKLNGSFSGGFFVVCKESKHDVENWLVNANFNVSDNYSYVITDISHYSGVLKYTK